MTTRVFGQNADTTKVIQIDSLVSLIPENVSNDSYFYNIQASGSIYKKFLGLFKLHKGGYSSCTIFHDSIIFSVENIYQYNKENKVLVETFYYYENVLAKYENRLSTKSDSANSVVLKHFISAYFDKNRLIKKVEIINDQYRFDNAVQLKIYEKATAEVLDWETTMKELNPQLRK